MKNTKSILVIICCQNPEKDKISKLAVKIDKIFKENQSYYIQPTVLSFSRVRKAAYIIANALKTLLYGDNIPWDKDQGDFENYIKYLFKQDKLVQIYYYNAHIKKRINDKIWDLGGFNP